MSSDDEPCTVLLTVEQAIDLARTGNVADGYEALLPSLHRAREAHAESRNGELVMRYRHALERFVQRYRVGRT